LASDFVVFVMKENRLFGIWSIIVGIVIRRKKENMLFGIWHLE